ncbi:uncharacterized protein LOC143344506 [Colletes latitarsis]|uniref:uncharacterized protein LOC143344506 n=1 Tax=Colletes latitarsis TaxID=2605962 RepID=UPI0040354A20
MYRQILVEKKDCDLRRIVWRDNPGEQLTSYRLRTVTYGMACAPYLAIRTLLQLSRDEEEAYPLAARCLRSDVYMDDVVSGSDTLEEAGQLQQQLLALLRAGGFKLRKCDQGTNFVGADRELRRLFAAASLDWAKLAGILAQDGTTWHFNPPAAPHFGGIWEAAVKSMKFHLRRVVGDTPLTYEEMATVLAQIEACLNSRPLSPLEVDTEANESLTPGHFLVGGPLTAVPEPSLTEEKKPRLTRWQLLQRMRDHFWKRWAAEYLQGLQSRHKWSQPQPNVQPGDLCLVTSEVTPPTKWPIGRILPTYPGDDGRVRVVLVKTPFSTIKRPVTKLCLYPKTPVRD